jgi:hypothetical protein
MKFGAQSDMQNISESIWKIGEFFYNSAFLNIEDIPK